MSHKSKTRESSELNYKVSAKTVIAGSHLSDDSPTMKMARDPKQAEAFLKKAGIIIRAGELAPEYKLRRVSTVPIRRRDRIRGRKAG